MQWHIAWTALLPLAWAGLRGTPCAEACRGDGSCEVLCSSLKPKLCSAGCEDLCEGPSCALCRKLLARFCRSKLLDAQLLTLPTELVVEPAPQPGSDMPTPVESGSELWQEALAQAEQAVALLNAEKNSLGAPTLVRAWSHVGRASQAFAGFKLCLRVPIAGEERYVRVDTAPVDRGVIGSERLIAVVGGDLAPGREDELASSRRLFPCPGQPPRHPPSRVLNHRLPRAAKPVAAFNTRAVYPLCAGRVGQQGACGGSYAFAVAGLASERLCIADHASKASRAAALEARLHAAEALFNVSVGEVARVRAELQALSLLQTPFVELSAQELVSCASARRQAAAPAFCTLGPEGQRLDRYALGCEGGSLVGALEYVHEFGLPRADCAPFHTEPVKHEVQWSSVDVCASLESAACHAERGLFKLGPPTRLRGEDAVMAAMHGGPVVAQMTVHADFGDAYPDGFTDGVYVVGNNTPALGSGTILLYGWGETDAGVHYWLGRNSWGTDWGLGGFVKIRRGTNEAGIEASVYSSDPLPTRGCVEVLPSPSACTLVNTCDSVRRVQVSYLGSEANCGSWRASVTLRPGHAHAHTLQNAHLCAVEADRFERRFDATLTYVDRTQAYGGPGTQPSCVLESTVQGRARCCGQHCATADAGRVASFPSMFCPAGCAESGGAVFEVDLA